MPRAVSLCVVLAVAAMVAASASAAGPKSIFDDDWTPPKATDAPRPVVIKTLTPADRVKPGDPIATPPKDPAPAAPAARRPIPAKEQQAAVRKVLKEVFASQLVDRTAAGRLRLTQALLAQADKSTDAPVDEFVLLAAAIDAGTEAASLPLAFDAADRMGKAFDVDAAAVKVDTTTKLGPKPATADAAAANVRAGLELTDRLAAADDYAAAARVCAALLAAAGGNGELRAQVVKRQREVTAARDAAERVAKDVEKLKASPDDPAANLVVGKYLCFTKGNWKDGLPLLARGNDAVLKTLAGKEIAGADSADGRVALGDAWWDAAASVGGGAAKGAMQAHAAEWYKLAAPESKGLTKARIEGRVAQAATSSAAVAARPATPGVEILGKMVEFSKCRVEGGAVVLKGSDRLTSPEAFAVPVTIRMVVQAQGGSIRIAYAANPIIFNHEDVPSKLHIHGGPANGMHKEGGGRVPVNTWSTIELAVTPQSMRISVDGELRQDVAADFSKVKDQLVIYPGSATLKVKSVQVKEGA